MATRCPAPRSSIPGSTAATLLTTPSTLTEITSPASPASSFVPAVVLLIPAFATSTSTLPHLASTRSATPFIAEGSRTSAGSASASPPPRSISSPNLNSSSPRRAVSPRRAPRLPNSNASARPMPDEAPVMRTTFPFQSYFIGDSAQPGHVLAEDAQGFAQVVLFYQKVVAREGGERADGDALRGEYPRDVGEEADHVPAEFHVERHQTEAASVFASRAAWRIARQSDSSTSSVTS